MTRLTLWRLDRSKVRVHHVAGRVLPVIGQRHDDQRDGEAERHDEEASQGHGDESDTT